MGLAGGRGGGGRVGFVRKKSNRLKMKEIIFPLSQNTFNTKKLFCAILYIFAYSSLPSVSNVPTAKQNHFACKE